MSEEYKRARKRLLKRDFMNGIAASCIIAAVSLLATNIYDVVSVIALLTTAFYLWGKP